MFAGREHASLLVKYDDYARNILPKFFPISIKRMTLSRRSVCLNTLLERHAGYSKNM
jgi:hypothetical protein